MSTVKLNTRINNCIDEMGFHTSWRDTIDDDCDECEQVSEREMVESIINGFKHRVIDVDYFHSGGGCMHLMFMLDSHHIITFHNASEQVDISYNRWE